MRPSLHPARAAALALTLACLAAAAPPRAAQAAGPEAPQASRALPADYWPRLLALESALKADPVSLQTGARYRQAIIDGGQYDRAIGLFRRILKQHPKSIEAHLNLAFACIDKVPDSGKIRQALLGKEAMDHLTAAIQIRPLPIAIFCRGLVNLFYDAVIFNRVRIGVADLARARDLQQQQPPRPYHARVYVSLGDGYWKLKDLTAARSVWSDGLARFPDDAELQKRMTRQGKQLEWTVRSALDPDNRVDTSLKEIWDDLPALGLR